MIEIKANFWDVYKGFDAIVCPTNGVIKKNGELVMGGGLAKQFKEKFPYVPFAWGQMVEESGNHICLYEHDEGLPDLLSFPSKNHWRDQSDPVLIRRSTEELVSLTDQKEYAKVLVPRVGCGLGGLTWAKVRPIMASRLDDRFTIITNE